MGFCATSEKMSLPIVSPFQITDPSNDPWPGTICLTQIPMPANISVKVGDMATIQLVLVAKHGASLFNVCYPPDPFYPSKTIYAYANVKPVQCVDIIFAEDGDETIEQVTQDKCFNSSYISFQNLYTTSAIGSGVAMPKLPQQTRLALMLLLLAVVVVALI
jgi:hypothetical protein